MSSIRIKNFGPIKAGLLENNGWIEVKKATIFIGDQGSGKSTVAKLISTFLWIEKALVRGDLNQKILEKKNKFKNQFLAYHRLENYLNFKSEIEFNGEAYNIKYEDGFLKIKEIETKSYSLPQIMYVPAERNFISYVRTPKELKFSSDSLKEFLTEFENAKENLKWPIQLPINACEIEYDKLNDILNLKGEGYKVKLIESSSGFQSLVPLYLISDYLANSVKIQSNANSEAMSEEEIRRFKKGVNYILTNDTLTDEQKRVALSVLSSKFNKTSFINIVEEPEQNLFPTSQWEILQSLLRFNNMNLKNKLIITTHSPYIINYLSILIQGAFLKEKIDASSPESKLSEKLFARIPKDAIISADEVIIYQLDETNGKIEKLETFEGIPSDENFLNKKLQESNNLFDYMLEIEQEL